MYLNNRLFLILLGNVLFLIAAFPMPFLLPPAKVSVLVTIGLIGLDALLLYAGNGKVMGKRKTGEKLSNGDENIIHIELKSSYLTPMYVKIIDELPEQLQKRDFKLLDTLYPKEIKKITYTIRPTKRGEYEFGRLNVFVSSLLGLVARKFIFSENVSVPVYPAFLQLRKYELLAISNRLSELGIKKIRRIGNNREFEQIKEYVQGDDMRTINWKATARRNNLMVNHYQDERSQHIYSIIDKGRTMKMPFESLSLLDYAINSALVISKIALLKDDKAGLITFGHKIDSFVSPNKDFMQMNKILEALYKQKTAYKEANFEKLYITIKHQIKQRSLILLYTNFESLSSMERQLSFLRKIAAHHVLVVIFFHNTELDSLINSQVENTEEIYHQTIAEKLAFEKKLIVKELQKHGIQVVLTKPQNLTVNTINKYLEIKAKAMI
ncbi:cell division protein FtsB [bacterium 336/3]|nr:cell division protein FtsB [bacterium 336/3]